MGARKKAHLWIRGGDRRSGIGRPVIDHDDLEFWIVERDGVPKALVKCGLRVVRADDDTDRRPLHVDIAHIARVPQRDRIERGAGHALGRGQTETPSVHGLVADPPFIGPREDTVTGTTAFDNGREMAIQDCGLRGTVVDHVHSEFANHEWEVAREMLKTPEVATKGFVLLEEDVEGHEVETLHL